MRRQRITSTIMFVAALAAVVPLSGSTPAVAASTCAGTPVEAIIVAHFPDDAGWALSIAARESGCDPCAFYPGQHDCSAWNPGTAKGLFQLLGHDDLIHAACPYLYPLPWNHPECNAIAARYLYDAAGRSPWGG